ncbi:hypothetical protein SVAN01_11321 [Stagonosporopsis vannaccii]|nr:hypothetical protein SVAN01_11321 [Stagonosporopsis vannaccii]
MLSALRSPPASPEERYPAPTRLVQRASNALQTMAVYSSRAHARWYCLAELIFTEAISRIVVQRVLRLARNPVEPTANA